MLRDTLQDIHQSARDFDLYDEVGEAAATKIIDDRAGEADITPDEDQFGCNGFDGVPLDKAIEVLRVSKSPVFQEIFSALKALHSECIEKSKNEKQTSDFRNLHHVKGLGVEQSLGVFTAILEDSEARLKAATPTERRAMGQDANQFISDLVSPVAEPQAEEAPKRVINVGPSSEEKPKSYPAPSAGIQANTRRAQEFFKKSDASRS
jgi:hypothetical protein